MSKDLLLDLSFLTEAERDLINNVISKDAQIRKAEQSRISSLRKKLDDLKETGLPEEELESKNEKYCARCQTYFGLVFNRGDYCPRCELRVCKVCRVNDIDEGWICTLCNKVREVKAQSGAWFFQGHKQKNGNLFGSMLVRQSLRRLPGSETKGKLEPSNAFIEDEEPANPFLEDEDDTNPFTSPSNGRITEKLSGQADLNSKESERKANHKMGYQYSDESDSEHGSDDESLEDRHDNASDRTRSKDTEGPHMSVHFEQEKAGSRPFDSEDDDENSEEGREEPRGSNVEISATNQGTNTEPRDTEIVQPANEENPSSPEGRINAMRAFSEAFVSTSLGLKSGESHEDRDTRKDRDSPEDRGYRKESGSYEDPSTSVDRDSREDRGYRKESGSYEYPSTSVDRDSPEDRGYLEDQETHEDRSYNAGQLEKHGYHEEQDSRDDHHGYRAESEGHDSRRSSDLHYEGFHADDESMISETSGYGTPSASEDTSSKRTPSISGDEGMNTPREDARRLPSESAPVIVTTEADDGDNNNFRNDSITDFEEDLDVSFSKYGAGLGNRKLKDQLSMGSRESIVSYYSNAGGEVYGKYPVSGEVLFGIKYDPKIQEFQIQIHQARGITAVDKKSNTSDPYVKTYLLPDRTRTGKRKSKVKKNTINPVFDEILTYKITYDEILQRTLWFAIWNHDSFGHNDFLGEVLVPIDQYHQSGFSLEDPEPQWYDLCERQSEDPQFSFNGEIVFALKYVPPSALAATKKKKKKKKAGEEKGELHINIIEATDLMAKDSNGFSDPFCKSYLLPDKSKKTKQKTAVVKKSLNPKWNYHFVYDNVTHEELMDRVLELTVWDFDRGSSNEFLGGVRLGLGTGLKEWDDSNSEEQAAWNKMLNNQNDWNQVRLTLRDNMGSHK